MMRLAGSMLLALACLLSGAAHAAAPAPHTAPLTIGEARTLVYADGDSREINVYLPDGYRTGTERYPVLYVIDGGLQQDFLHVAGTSALNAVWGRSLPVIVVGVETKDRRAELIGSQGTAEQHKQYPTAGQSARFRAFLRDKVKPLVEANYRANGQDGVLGESLAGLFIVETWLREPALFDRYAAIDASLWWDGQALSKAAAGLLAAKQPRGALFLTYSNEGPETSDAADRVAAVAGPLVCLAPRTDLTHATAYHTLSPQALQFLFPTDNKHDPEWGFEVPCSKRS
ncbi:putative alpha/beta superfamily hydrolase [Novosphingobium chloroacetimidivorans]|uniref:Putative alpha/beta superfamily hydrolase n=1 Tax=Novosphingobium chloroacetimidivorans TaxID=1428314 RepID=A0A7W7KBJ8_9SPHN|nr:alpha/beta hydrolase-fold protein [Novosphingobium chloroacetimidivorans]MBB4859795.1 putative alpha/beta superfamily hydrolase [Novosphingobium chloroacetimidivorans]